MRLNVRSKSPEANAHLSLGLDNILRFRERPDNMAVLNEAERDLAIALEQDPAFLPAMYYRAIVRQLKGENDLAISDLTSVIETKSPFNAEARFNLGVALFNKNYREDLEEAESEFQTVLKSKAISKQLRLQTLASLTEVYCRLMIQKNPEQPHLEAVQENFRRVLQVEIHFRSGLYAEKTKEEKLDPEIESRIENALGLGYMFAADYCSSIAPPEGSEIPRATLLREARERFERADTFSPDNWAILCNLGSIWMRFCYWISTRARKDTAHESTERSEHFLMRVIDKVRPNYGFALYELGRLHRINGDFAVAEEWFGRAAAIHEPKRNVSESSLNREIQRARNHSTVFP
jgi:tetratricopeptide (TPR) repeat protein